MIAWSTSTLWEEYDKRHIGKLSAKMNSVHSKKNQSWTKCGRKLSAYSNMHSNMLAITQRSCTQCWPPAADKFAFAARCVSNTRKSMLPWVALLRCRKDHVRSQAETTRILDLDTALVYTTYAQIWSRKYVRSITKLCSISKFWLHMKFGHSADFSARSRISDNCVFPDGNACVRSWANDILWQINTLPRLWVSPNCIGQTEIGMKHYACGSQTNTLLALESSQWCLEAACCCFPSRHVLPI